MKFINPKQVEIKKAFLRVFKLFSK